jgi:hypothetical protein
MTFATNLPRGEVKDGNVMSELRTHRANDEKIPGSRHGQQYVECATKDRAPADLSEEYLEHH